MSRFRNIQETGPTPQVGRIFMALRRFGVLDQMGRFPGETDRKRLRRADLIT